MAKVLSLQDSLRCSTRLRNRWCHHKNSALRVTSYIQTYKSQNLFWFTSNGFLKRPSLFKYWLLHPFSTRKPHAKAVSRKDYFTHLRTLKTQERDAEWSAPTIAGHIHGASEHLGTPVAQRYDVPWDWLWYACHMAGVHWGSHCEGFCSKEGPHYRLEQSTRKL